MSDVVQSVEKWPFSFTIVSFVDKLIVLSKHISSKGGFFAAMVNPRGSYQCKGGTRKLMKQLTVNEMMKYNQGGGGYQCKGGTRKLMN